MRTYVHKPWFALADLICASISSVIWFFQPEAGWWPLWIALLPWLVRLLAGQFPWRRTPMDLPAAIFLLTAVLGTFISSNPTAAWPKFWLLLAAFFIFYALAAQPSPNFWVIAWIITLSGLVVAANFLLTYNWEVQPLGPMRFNQIGLWLMSVRPDISLLPSLHPNVAASLMAMVLPFGLAITLRLWQERQRTVGMATAVICIIISTALLLTASRGALGALAISFCLWGCWQISQWLAKHLRQTPKTVFPVVLVSLIGVSLLFSFIRFDNLTTFMDQFPSPAGVGSRLELMRGTIALARDFRMTGSGLGTFPGLYSQYVQTIPFFLLGHGHNLFLNMVLEQGFWGLIALLGLLGGSGWLVLTRPFSPSIPYGNYLRWAILMALSVMIWHGLIDDPLYGQRGSPLLLAIPGLAVALAQSESRWKWSRRTISLGFVSILALFLLYTWPVKANWYANRGSLAMSQIELADWPTNAWDEGEDVAELEPAAKWFEQGLKVTENNSTIHYRLGRIAILKRDYKTAVSHLEIAYRANPNHRGIIKSLAYSYVWLGQFQQAASLLEDIPEAADEMEVYIWWWRTQQQEELSTYAAQMAAMLP
jgi:O-antigen ligase